MLEYYRLDNKDLIVLRRLTEDSRTSLSQIAEELGVSIPTVGSRIEKLKGLGIIQKFSLALSYELISEHPCFVLLIKPIPRAIETTIDRLSSIESIVEIIETVGSYPLVARTLPLSPRELYAVISEVGRSTDIVEITTLPFHTVHKNEIGRLPSQDINVRIRCEYCGKTAEREYQTVEILDVVHFFCCAACVGLFRDERGIQSSVSNSKKADITNGRVNHLERQDLDR